MDRDRDSTLVSSLSPAVYPLISSLSPAMYPLITRYVSLTYI